MRALSEDEPEFTSSISHSRCTLDQPSALGDVLSRIYEPSQPLSTKAKLSQSFPERGECESPVTIHRFVATSQTSQKQLPASLRTSNQTPESASPSTIEYRTQPLNDFAVELRRNGARRCQRSARPRPRPRCGCSLLQVGSGRLCPK
ncbi:hypothetical protein BO99DRAFT_184594 [Aspergillus violaceofuscus CBS 115571]|uniref:Uncharacterized protein n=1 Tax=Aspergillus violaceofuscus (strain CBS 115571) TaxID=1450538 RepID=A0A2V5H2U3_ASPV1|nr:hypothetical protein BO99DRAFT_184594 [Aspergillus violaceofuscus CBS 115571]